MTSLLKRYRAILIILFLTLASYSTLVIKQTANIRPYPFYEYLIPGSLYGTPENIAAHGMTPKRDANPKASGWDGAFYYYLADDPLLLKDTLTHLDGPEYRSQRIGLAMFAKGLSILLFQEWVSPAFYFGLCLLLMLLGTGVLAHFLKEEKQQPALSLLWSLSATPFFLLLFGFTDAAADAFLIVGLTALYKNKIWLYIAAMTLASLSRENYVIFPVIIAGLQTTLYLAQKLKTKTLPHIRSILAIAGPHIIPAISTLAWQHYVHHMVDKVRPDGASSVLPGVIQVGALISMPFAGTIDAVTNGALRPYVPLFAGFRDLVISWQQTIGISFFLLLTLAGLYISALAIIQMTKDWYNNDFSQKDSLKASMMGGFFVTCLLYSCFTPGMLWAPIGYVKATGFFALTFCYASYMTDKVKKWPFYLLFITSNIYYVWYIWESWAIK